MKTKKTIIEKIDNASLWCSISGLSTLSLIVSTFIMFMFFRDTKLFEISIYTTGLMIMFHIICINIYYYLTSKVEYVMYYYDHGVEAFIDSYIESLEKTEINKSFTKEELINNLRIIQYKIKK